VNRRLAKVLREELGVDAVLVPTLELYADAAPPKVAMSVRLVEASTRPVVLWGDVVARSGDDSPGLLGLGLVATAALEKRVVAAVARSVARYVVTRARGTPAALRDGSPRRSFRAPVLDDVGRQTVACCPSRTRRPGAGRGRRPQPVRGAARAVEVLQCSTRRGPGRSCSRTGSLEGGVSVDTAIAVLDLCRRTSFPGDVGPQGTARARAPPTVEFTAFVLDRVTGELVWSSYSDGRGTAASSSSGGASHRERALLPDGARRRRSDRRRAQLLLRRERAHRVANLTFPSRAVPARDYFAILLKSEAIPAPAGTSLITAQPTDRST
jgi:hypothetical protein